MNWGQFDFSGFEQQFDRLNAAINEDLLMRSAERIINQAADTALRLVKERTPSLTGWMRRNWKRTQITKQGNDLVVTVYNNTEYAFWVEYGHRQQPGRFVPGYWSGGTFVYDPKAKGGMVLKQSWVEGQFMLTITMSEVRKLLPRITEREINRALKEIFEA